MSPASTDPAVGLRRSRMWVLGVPVEDLGHLLLTPGFAICLGLSPTSPCRKGRKKVAPDGVKLVDEVRAHLGGRISSGGWSGLSAQSEGVCCPRQALLCQTQLRSLSKSDTKLHELYRVKVRDDGEWPWSRGSPRDWWLVATVRGPRAAQRVRHVTDRRATVLALCWHRGWCLLHPLISSSLPQSSARPAWISPVPRPLEANPCTAPASCTVSCPRSPSLSPRLLPQPPTRPTPTCSSPHCGNQRQTLSMSAWQWGGRTPRCPPCRLAPRCPLHGLCLGQLIMPVCIR